MSKFRNYRKNDDIRVSEESEKEERSGIMKFKSFNSNEQNSAKLDKYLGAASFKQQAAERGEMIFKAFDGKEYQNLSFQELFDIEMKIRKLLNFELDSTTWDEIQGFEPLYMVLFSNLTNVRIKVAERRVKFPDDKNGFVSIPVVYEIMKSKNDQINNKGKNSKFVEYVFRDVQAINFKLADQQVSSKADLLSLNANNDDRYKFFLPMFKIEKHTEEYLRLRVQAECCPTFRNDFKQCILLSYFATDLWPRLTVAKYLKWFFDYFGLDPFALNQFGTANAKTFKHSHVALIMNILLNMIPYEVSVYNILQDIGCGAFVGEFLQFILSDTPALQIKEFSDGISNNLKVFMFSSCESFKIPTMFDDTFVGVADSFSDNVTDYRKLTDEAFDWARSHKIPSLIKILVEIVRNPCRNSVILAEFISGLPNISGYSSSDQVEAVKRQIFTGKDIIHEQYGVDSSEAEQQAIKDWDSSKDLIVNKYSKEDYDEQRAKYFESKQYERDYIPKDFTCGEDPFFHKVTNYITEITQRTTCFEETKILNEAEVRRNIYKMQTPKSSGLAVKMLIPSKFDAEQVGQRGSSQIYTKAKFKEDMIMTLVAKRSLITLLPSDYLLSLLHIYKDIADISLHPDDVKRILITTGNRKVPGSKQIRFIFVVPWYHNLFNQSIGYHGLKIQKRMPNLAKPVGIFIRDYWEIIKATSSGKHLNVFLDFSTFDGSCGNFIQKPIYDVLHKYYNFEWNDKISIGSLLRATQEQMYRCFMLVSYAGELHSFILDMILSGELLTNSKDSLINYGLVAAALSELRDKDINYTYELQRLKINGDDSYISLDIPLQYANRIDKVSNKRGRKILTSSVNLDAYNLNLIDGWATSLTDLFKKVGFKLSDAKGGVQMSFAEYLKVWIKFGIVITNWRAQLFTSEKETVISHQQAISSTLSIARLMAERGMDVNYMYRYAKLNALNGRRISSGVFYITNFVDLFNPSSGYSIPASPNLMMFPNSTMYSRYLMFRSSTYGIRNEVIARYLINAYMPPSNDLYKYITDSMIDGNAKIISKTVSVEPRVGINEFNTTRSGSRISASIHAFQQLKGMGIRISKNVAYFNGFQNYVASGLTSAQFSRPEQMKEFELSNYKYFRNLTTGLRGIAKLSPEEIIISNVYLTINGVEKVYNYSSDMTNIGIGSNEYFIMLKELLGYSRVDSHPDYEKDVMDFIMQIDPEYPRELSQEMLLRVLLKPEFLTNHLNFDLACRVMGLSEAVSLELQGLLTRNYVLYLCSINVLNFSSVSQFLTMWDLTYNNLRQKFNFGAPEGEGSLVDRIAVTLAFQHLIHNCKIDKGSVYYPNTSIEVMSNAYQAVILSRGF